MQPPFVHNRIWEVDDYVSVTVSSGDKIEGWITEKPPISGLTTHRIETKAGLSVIGENPRRPSTNNWSGADYDRNEAMRKKLRAR